MDFSTMSDEELLKPDAETDFSAMSDEELLKPDAKDDISKLSDEELLKPDAPQDLEQLSDEELLKPDAQPSQTQEQPTQDQPAAVAQKPTPVEQPQDTHWQEMDERARQFNLGDAISDAAETVGKTIGKGLDALESGKRRLEGILFPAGSIQSEMAAGGGAVAGKMMKTAANVPLNAIEAAGNMFGQDQVRDFAVRAKKFIDQKIDTTTEPLVTGNPEWDKKLSKFSEMGTNAVATLFAYAVPGAATVDIAALSVNTFFNRLREGLDKGMTFNKASAMALVDAGLEGLKGVTIRRLLKGANGPGAFFDKLVEEGMTALKFAGIDMAQDVVQQGFEGADNPDMTRAKERGQEGLENAVVFQTIAGASRKAAGVVFDKNTDPKKGIQDLEAEREQARQKSLAEEVASKFTPEQKTSLNMLVQELYGVDTDFQIRVMDRIAAKMKREAAEGSPVGKDPLRSRLDDPAEMEKEIQIAAEELLFEDNAAEIAKSINTDTLGVKAGDQIVELVKVMPRTADKAESRLAGEIRAANPEMSAERVWELAEYLAAHEGEISRDGKPLTKERVAEIEKQMSEDASGTVPVEQPDGSLKTVNEVEAESAREERKNLPPDETNVPAPETKPVGLSGKWTPVAGKSGVWHTPEFPDVEIALQDAPVAEAEPGKAPGKIMFIENLPEPSALDENGQMKLGKFLVDQLDIATKAGIKEINIGKTPEDAAKYSELVDKYEQKVTGDKFQVRADSVIGLLKKSGLASDVIATEEEFNAKLASYGKDGQRLIADGKTYGFTDGTNVYLNPAFFRTRIGLNTPIHEFGHLAIIATKNVNRAVYDRALKLIKDTGYWKEVSEHPDYASLPDWKKAEEALTRLIAERGERLEATTPKGVIAEIKKLLVEIWKSFGNALGIRDLTPEKIEKMSVEDLADAIRAEMMTGREFGTRELSLQEGDLKAKILRFAKYSKPTSKSAKAALEAAKKAWKELSEEQKVALGRYGDTSVLKTQEARTIANGVRMLREWDARRARISQAVKDQIRRSPNEGQKKIITGSPQYYVSQVTGDVTSPFAYAIDRGLPIPRNGDWGWDAWDRLTDGMKYPEKRELMRILGGEHPKRGGMDTVLSDYAQWLGISWGEGARDFEHGLGIEDFLGDILKERAKFEQWKSGDRKTREENEAERASTEDLTKVYDAIANGEPPMGLRPQNKKDAAIAMSKMAELSRDGKLPESVEAFDTGANQKTYVKFTYGDGSEFKIYGDAKSITAWAEKVGLRRTASVRQQESGKTDAEFAEEDAWVRASEARRVEAERMGEQDDLSDMPDFSRAQQPIMLSRGQMPALAKAKVGEWVKDTSPDSVRNAIEQKIEKGLAERDYRFKKPEDRMNLVKNAVRFYKRFSQKTIMLSDGRVVYFVPDARSKVERGLNNDEAWAEYAIHAVTSSGEKTDGKPYAERLYNRTKAANIWKLEDIIKAERCEAKIDENPERDGVIFYGRGVDGKAIQIITRLDEKGNIYADLTEVTVVNAGRRKNLPPRRPLTEVVRTVANRRQRGGLLTADRDSVSQTDPSDNGVVMLSRGGLSEAGRTPVSEEEFTRLEKEFGTTRYMSEAGYILPNGKLLDLSGRKQGYSGKDHSRHVDHRELTDVIVRTDGNDAMQDVIASGAIRIGPESGVIDLGNLPNAKQKDVLWDFIDRFNGEVTVDFRLPNGNNDGGAAYREGTSARRILQDIENYFADGTLPEGTAEETMFSRGGGARLVGGRTRVAADQDHGERSPGGLAAARELADVRNSPVSALGARRFLSLSISDMEELRKIVTGDVMPTAVAKNLPSGGLATKRGGVTLHADVIGTVDRTDMDAEKANLKAHGFYRNEDPSWAMGQTDAAIRAEKQRSDAQLERQLIALGERRINRQEPGAQTAERGVFADQVAKLIMAEKRHVGGRLGRLQTIGKKVQDAVANMPGMNAADAEWSAKRFLDWAYGIPNYSQNMSGKELTAEMFGKWLVMPKELEARAPEWANGIEGVIAGDRNLADAFRTLADRRLHGDEYLIEKIRKQMSRETQETLNRLNNEKDEPISAGSTWKDLTEQFIYGMHDRFGPVYIRMDAATKTKIKAMKKALKAAPPAARPALKQRLDLYLGNLADKLNKLELARTAYERGNLNEGSVYHREMLRLENEATERWGLTTEDMSLYLDQWRVIETSGRSASFGEDVVQARRALGDMANRLGAQKWRRMQEFGNKWFAIHERELLDDPRAERMFGKAWIDYLRQNTHYVATERVHSQEELDAIDMARRSARAAGVTGGDDVVSQMYDYAGAKGAGKDIGEGGWTAKMTGSFAAKADVRGATLKKVDRLQRALRRNQLVLDLRDALEFAGVKGIRDLPRTEGAEYPSGNRYGHLNYIENGKKRTLVVPRQIADAFARGETAKWYTKTTRMIHNTWRSLIIDWNPAYWPMNVRRNQDSIEKNMPGMRETYLKTALRATFPGLGTLSDLSLQTVVRNIPATAKVFSDKTVFYYIPQAERICKIVESPSEWQQKYWDAQDRNDLAKIQQMNEDWRLAKEMLKANMFVSIGSVHRGENSQTFTADQFAKKGLRTIQEIDRALQSRSRGKRALDALCWVAKKNQAQQEHEDVLAKAIAYLADRKHFGLARTAAESGDLVNRRVSIAQGERKGAAAGTMKLMIPFYNMIEKGVVRHYNAYKTDFGHTLGADAKFIVGRVAGSLLANGVALIWMLNNCDGDEENAKKKFGIFFRYAKAYHDAYRSCSEYVRKNYQFTPFWTKGYTSIIIGGAMTDEEKLLSPIVDYTANAIAASEGIGEMPSFGSVILDSTVRAVVPDLQMTGPIIEGLRLAVVAATGENQTDYFRDAPMFDQRTLDNRFASAEDFKGFAAAVGARLWNYGGGRSIIAADVNGVDNGRGEASEPVEWALTKVPWISPLVNRMVKIQVGSPDKDTAAIKAQRKSIDSLLSVCAERMLERKRDGMAFHEHDWKGYEAQIQKYAQTYKLDEFDVAKLKEKYLNGFQQWKCRDAYDQRTVIKMKEEARRQGKTESAVWVMLGER